MPVDFTNGLAIFSSGLVLKAFAVLFVIFYLFFAFMIWRQTQLMVSALPTQVAPFLKFIALFQAGVALAFLFIVIGGF